MTLIVAVRLFQALVTLLRLKTQRRIRTRLQAGNGNRLAGFLAKAVLPVVNAFNRLIDFVDQLALTITRTRGKRAFASSTVKIFAGVYLSGDIVKLTER